MDSSIHAHLISQHVKDRIAQAEAAHVAGTLERRRGVRMPRIAWRHSQRRLGRAALNQK